MLALIHRAFRSLGFDVIRYPAGTSYGVAFNDVLAATAADLVVDVGGHAGDFAAMLRSRGYQGRIVSFEPVPASYERLERLERNDPGWEVRHLALGERDETRELNVAASPDLSSFLRPSGRGKRHFHALIETAPASVPVRRLDGVDLGDYRIAAVKIDTQGWDMAVLRGAAGILDRVAAVQVELALQPYYDGATDYLEMLAWLHDAGFAPVNLHPITWDDGLLAEADCVLRRVRPTSRSASSRPMAR